MDTLEKISDTLGCELKDLFEFSPARQAKKEIIALLKEADQQKLNMIYTIVRAIVR